MSFIFYGLDRFSKGLDFDAEKKVVLYDKVKSFCLDMGFDFNVKKDTETTKRYMIHYSVADASKVLKVEVSHRGILKLDVVKGNVCYIYSISGLLSQKSDALILRSKARDVYDVYFILEHYFNAIRQDELVRLRERIYRIGIDELLYKFTEDQKRAKLLEGVFIVPRIFEILQL